MRTQRAQLKRDLKEGRCTIAVVLTTPPPCVQTMKVTDLLLALPKYEPVKANKPPAQSRIAATKTIGGISRRQLDELISRLTN